MPARSDSPWTHGKDNQFRTGLSHCVLIFLQKFHSSRSKFPSLNVYIARETKGWIFMFKYNYDAGEFGARIKGLRKKSKMTQETLADLLYLSVDSVSRMENGKVMCMPEHVVHICEIFNVFADYLYFGKIVTGNSQNENYNKISKMLANCDKEELNRIEQVLALFLIK